MLQNMLSSEKTLRSTPAHRRFRPPHLWVTCLLEAVYWRDHHTELTKHQLKLQYEYVTM